MKKLQFQVRPIAHIVLPGHAQQEGSTLAATNSVANFAFDSADLGALPEQVEFQNLFWNKTLVSLEGVIHPRPDTVWIRPSPLEYPEPLRIPKIPPPPQPPEAYRVRSHHAAKEKLGFIGIEMVKGIPAGKESWPSGRHANYPPTSSPITVSRSYGDVARDLATVSTNAGTSPMIIMPPQIEFEDAFWNRIQVPTAKCNQTFLEGPTT